MEITKAENAENEDKNKKQENNLQGQDYRAGTRSRFDDKKLNKIILSKEALHTTILLLASKVPNYFAFFVVMIPD